jgi:hypothetical protein
VKTLKVSLTIGQLVRRDGFACRDKGQRAKPLGSRMTKVNALREPHKGVILQVKGRDASQVAPVRWADVDIVPERSEWDAVRAG